MGEGKNNVNHVLQASDWKLFSILMGPCLPMREEETKEIYKWKEGDVVANLYDTLPC